MDIDIKQETIGWTAFAFTLYFLLWPVIPFYKVIRGKLNYEDAPGAYATINYLNCLCWYLYSDLIYSDQIKIINLVGMLTNGFFVIIYLFFEIKKYIIDSVLNCLILSSGTYMIYLSLAITIEEDTVIGKICAGTFCLYFFFPIQLIYRVFKQKNFMLIPFYSVFTSLFMSIFWIIYGTMITEIYLVFPHCINIFFTSLQIILYLYYRKKYPIFKEKEIISTIGIENIGNEENKNQDSKIKEDIEDNEEMSSNNEEKKSVKNYDKENN